MLVWRVCETADAYDQIKRCLGNAMLMNVVMEVRLEGLKQS